MRIELAVAVGLGVALAAAGGARPPVADGVGAPEMGGVTLEAAVQPDGSRGCNVTLTANNTGTSNLKIDNTSQVRAKPSLSPSYGTWKKLWETDQYVRAGQSWSDVVNMDFGCSYVRQYRFVIAYGGNEKAFTYPSSGGTKVETVSLGNLYTKFFD